MNVYQQKLVCSSVLSAAFFDHASGNNCLQAELQATYC